MDCSPILPNRAGPGGASPLSEQQVEQLVDTYAALVRRTAAAVARHYDPASADAGAMIWTSFDRLWDRPHQNEGDSLHVGVKPFLDRLWPMLQTEFAWSLAIRESISSGAIAATPRDRKKSQDSQRYRCSHAPIAALLPARVRQIRTTMATLDRRRWGTRRRHSPLPTSQRSSPINVTSSRRTATTAAQAPRSPTAPFPCSMRASRDGQVPRAATMTFGRATFVTRRSWRRVSRASSASRTM